MADWSSHHADHHASHCVASFVASRKLDLHPSVYYASSLATQAIQAADLVAGIFRRAEEGDEQLEQIAGIAEAVCSVPVNPGLTTLSGRPYRNRITLF